MTSWLIRPLNGSIGYISRKPTASRLHLIRPLVEWIHLENAVASVFGGSSVSKHWVPSVLAADLDALADGYLDGRPAGDFMGLTARTVVISSVSPFIGVCSRQHARRHEHAFVVALRGGRYQSAEAPPDSQLAGIGSIVSLGTQPSPPRAFRTQVLGDACLREAGHRLRKTLLIEFCACLVSRLRSRDARREPGAELALS